MTTFTTKPTIVIVPASFTPPDFYDTFISQLSTHDYDAFAISLPSVGGKKAVTMTDDAAAISSVTSKLADEGKDIILVSHSYGAVPATESANSLGKSQRQASGKKGGISGLVYVAAFVTAPGESLEKTAGNASVDYVKVDVSVTSVDFVGTGTFLQRTRETLALVQFDLSLNLTLSGANS